MLQQKLYTSFLNIEIVEKSWAISSLALVALAISKRFI
jgi:hypothetical protein